LIPQENVVARQDYLPFGMEMLPGTALPPETFGGDTADTETQQGYFIARQLAARNGRFLSVDFIGGESLDPQTLNRYSYARNNPERYIDPLGEDRPPNRIRLGLHCCGSHSIQGFSSTARGPTTI
jgi:RHS repeat-associated protein